MRVVFGIVVAIMVLGGPANGGYRPLEPRYERPWASEAIAAPEAPRVADGLPVTLLAVLVALIAGVLIGYSAGRPNQAAVLADIEAAFKTRRHEAVVHARKKRLSPALAEARRGVLKAMEKRGLIASGWPSNPPPP